MGIQDILMLAVTFGLVLAFFAAMFFVLSQISGWSGMARRFPAAPAHDASWKFGSMAMGMRGMRYNNCVRIGVDDEHLHIRMLKIFSAYHRPISIPWALIEFPGSLPTGRWTLGFIELRVSGGQRVWLSPQAVRREIEVRRAMAEPADMAGLE